MTYNKKLDVNNIQSLEDVKNVFKVMNLISNIQKENEDYEILSKYFTLDYEAFKFELVEQPRKSLEEIQQELEEKIDKLIEKTKEKFNTSYDWIYILGRYNEFCAKQDGDFAYAKSHGYFLEKPKWVMTNAISANSNFTSTFVIKQGNKHEGYYTIGNGYLRFYMPYKPNFLIRFCADKLLGFKWIDDK